MVAELFATACRRAMERQMPALELLQTVGKLGAANETALVATLYRTWIDYNPTDPLIHAMWFNYGVILTNANDLDGARAALEQAIKINPMFMAPYINLGTVLERQGR